MSINDHSSSDPHATAGADLGDDTATRAAVPGQSDGSQAAARLLEMTAREIDQWRAEAKQEAAGIVSAASDEAAAVVRAAREEAGRLVAAAQEQAAQAVDDARVEAYRVREESTAERRRQDEEIARLQQVATEHRQRLRHHLNDMLDQVDAVPGTGSGEDRQS